MTSNQQISQKLREHATELARQGDNLYRVRAFRHAAMAVLSLPEDLNAIIEAGGVQALEQLPGVGKSLATTIAAYLSSLNHAKPVAA